MVASSSREEIVSRVTILVIGFASKVGTLDEIEAGAVMQSVVFFRYIELLVSAFQMLGEHTIIVDTLYTSHSQTRAFPQVPLCTN